MALSPWPGSADQCGACRALRNCEGAVLHAKDLTGVAPALLGKGPHAKTYLGAKFEAEGKYRSGSERGSNPAEIEFADFVVTGRIRGADEVHVVCAYQPSDPAPNSLLELVAHATPVLSMSGTVTGADRSDSEGKIVAFVKLKGCMVTKKGP